MPDKPRNTSAKRKNGVERTINVIYVTSETNCRINEKLDIEL